MTTEAGQPRPPTGTPSPGWRQLWRRQFDAGTEERFVHSHFRRIRQPLLAIAPIATLSCHLSLALDPVFASVPGFGLPAVSPTEIMVLSALWLAIALARDSKLFAVATIAYIAYFELHLALALPRRLDALEDSLPLFGLWPLVMAPLASRIRTFTLALGVSLAIPVGWMFALTPTPVEWLGVLAYFLLNALLTLLVFICSDRARRESYMANLRLEERAGKDALTGLPNRRSFFDACEPLLDECAAHGEPMALCFLDLDHFKSINDNHGHDVGDRVLQGVAQAILARQQAHDLSARIGGEEFILVWPGLTRMAAQRRAVSLLEVIAGLSQPGLKVSASIGLCLRDEGESLPELMRRADMALLRAKRNGRARVELAGQE